MSPHQALFWFEVISIFNLLLFEVVGYVIISYGIINYYFVRFDDMKSYCFILRMDKGPVDQKSASRIDSQKPFARQPLGHSDISPSDIVELLLRGLLAPYSSLRCCHLHTAPPIEV